MVSTWLTASHFEQPLWLLIFPALLGVGYLWRRASQSQDHWADVCDPELLPILLEQGSQQSTRKTGLAKVALPLTTVFVSTLLAIAAAQPVWQKQPVPAYKQGGAVVIALDLSASMFATDLKPNRLQRARFKIEDLIHRLPDSQIALLVYAGDAFAVTPLTEDTSTILAQLPVMDPSIMPVPGNRADIAIAKANEMLDQAGIKHGNILLVSDEVEPAQVASQATRVAQQGRTLSILAVGTEQGAPIPTNAGPMKDASGKVIIAQTHMKDMREAASLGKGQAYALVANDSDIKSIAAVLTADHRETVGDTASDTAQVDTWVAEGPWFVLLALPFLLPLFRRGLLNLLLPVAFIGLALSGAPPAEAGVWQDLWQTPNQQAQQAFQQGDKQSAAQQFTDPRWKQVAEYESDNLAGALDSMPTPETATDWYNRGNVLAKQGEVDPAIDAYDKALALQADFDDAAYNKALLEKLKDQQEQEQDQQSQNQDKNQQQQDQTNQDQQGGQQSQQGSDDPNQQESSQNQQGKSSDQKNSDSQSDDKNSENSSEEETNPSQSADDQNADGKSEPQPSNQTSQQENDAAQQQAAEYLKQQMEEAGADTEKEAPAGISPDSEPMDESEQARQQLINRIVDDPAGLWRRKFLYQYRQQAEPQATEGKTW